LDGRPNQIVENDSIGLKIGILLHLSNGVLDHVDEGVQGRIGVARVEGLLFAIRPVNSLPTRWRKRTLKR
jgi:hypothetical protein